MPIKSQIKPLLQKIIIPVYQYYASRDRRYRYGSISVTINPGVFHPGFFFSTKLLLKHLSEMPLANCSFLELGAGSGLISVFAAGKGAKVTASDISKTAVENVRENAQRNRVSVAAIVSDLFENIPLQKFDIIVINPPYYPQKPRKESQYAWFCGENFEYFQRLFPQMRQYANRHSEIIMVLSEDCDINRIRQIASENNFSMELVLEKKGWWETNYIFRICVV